MVVAKAKIRSAVRFVLTAMFYAAVVLLFASLLNQGSADLADRVDRNVETTTRYNSALVCILEVNPLSRTRAYVNECLELNGIDPNDIALPEGSTYERGKP